MEVFTTFEVMVVFVIFVANVKANVVAFWLGLFKLDQF